MKRTTAATIRCCLEDLSGAVTVAADVASGALRAIERMLAVPRRSSHGGGADRLH